jgi:hypothetical protein
MFSCKCVPVTKITVLQSNSESLTVQSPYVKPLFYSNYARHATNVTCLHVQQIWLGPVKYIHDANKSNLFYIQNAHMTTLWLNLGIQLKNRLAMFTPIYYSRRDSTVTVVTKLQYGCTRLQIPSVWTNTSATWPDRHWRPPSLLLRE